MTQTHNLEFKGGRGGGFLHNFSSYNGLLNHVLSPVLHLLPRARGRQRVEADVGDVHGSIPPKPAHSVPLRGAQHAVVGDLVDTDGSQPSLSQCASTEQAGR